MEVLQYVSEGNIVQRRFASMPDGKKLELDIVRPVEGTTVSCSVRVVGSITYIPGQNMLHYNFRDSAGKQLSTGLIPVTAYETGGVFEAVVDLEYIPAGRMVFLEVVDFSGAYNTLRTMDSVALQVI